MLQHPDEDKIIRENHFDRDMAMTLKDGRRIPVKGHVTEKVHKSGKVDVQIAIDKPFELMGENPQPGIDQ